MKKIYVSLGVVVLLFLSGTIFAATRNFPDVPRSSWFYQDVMNMVDWNVIQGNSDGTFKPSNTVNRAELAAILNRYNSKVSFEDDKLKFSLIQSYEQSANLYQNLSSIYGIAANGNPSCTMLEYYYTMMERTYEAAKQVSNSMTTNGLKVDTKEYDKKLNNYRFLHDECSF